MQRSNSYGRLFPGTPELVVVAPPEFFCPISQSLMIEPVRLCNTGQDFDRRSLDNWRRSGCQHCPVTGQRLHGWVVLWTNHELRAAIHLWAESMQLDLELIAMMTFRLLDKHASSRARAISSAASSAPAGGGLLADSPSPSRSLLSIAVPEDGTWAQQGAPELGVCWLGDGRNPSIDSSASTVSIGPEAVMLRARSRSL
ncbi:hypothetical protein WJX81_006722 [Elliptochloris bilobata]|uniref:U-box domain-containing protein n=1 Tax=Elliptochloris bilobata TaxID=381761 RepID=A0AAW1RKC0_9CHLO